MSSSLPSFLRVARDAAFKKSSRPLTVVLGNTSADLDSFISAVVFAYFHTRKSNTNDSKIYVPLLNLTDVPSSNLWRMRPEYGTALRLAVHGTSDEGKEETEKSLLQALVTIADLRNDSSSGLHATFAAGPDGEGADPSKENVVLVDHNAPQVPGLGSEELSQRFNLTGTIDHHVDENVVLAEVSPRIIQTGIGSCTSLVVKHLRDAGLWPAPSKGEAQTDLIVLAKLALAPILIDTANLTATGDKISDIDRDAVRFLETHITPLETGWDRTAFYDAIQESKSNKLKLLSMDEIFESDYKEWTEQSSSTSQPLTIGIASLVKDLPWLIQHVGSAVKLAEAMDSFARKTTSRDLSILCLITKGNGPDGEFRKELAMVAYGEVASKALGIFKGDAGELKLGEWREDEELLKALGGIARSETGVGYKVWWQGDVSKSRKQVAPLLRGAVEKA